MEFNTYSVFNVEYLIAKIAEGRTVQYRHYRNVDMWSDYKPGNHEMPFSISNPHTWNTMVWRVKPEIRKFSYELYLVRNVYGSVYVTTNRGFNPEIETVIKTFDQQEIEYEVE